MADSGVPISGLLRGSATLSDAVAVLAPAAGILDRIFYNDVATNIGDDSVSIWLSLILDGQLGFDLPGGFAIKLGQGDDVTPLTLGLRVSSAGVAITVEQLAVVLAIPPSLLRPAPPKDGGDVPDHVELVLEGALVFDETRRFQVEGFDSVSLSRSFVGSTSIVISATDVSIDTARGLIVREARIELPKDLPQLAPEELVLDDAVIGPDGVSGKLEALYTPQFDPATKQFVGRGSGELAGVPFAFASIAIELRDNSLVKGSLAGQLLLPFFDHPTDVAIALRADGSFSLDLASQTSLATIERAGLLRLAVEHLGFEVTGGKLIVHTGGTVTLLIGDAEWPSFRASDISIDSDGHISVKGAGLVLRDGKPLNLGASPTGVGRIPGINVDKLAVSGNPLDDGLVVDAQVSTVAAIGPVTATLKEIGVHARLALSGTHVVADQLALHAASGVGLSIDAAGVVVGGGFLFHDETAAAYGGAMKLTLHDELTLTAYGLIATRLPDGKPGYSLLIFITADGFQPIPLGLGFMLTSIGGLVGVNRTFDYDVLRAGLKADTLATLLFPRDPVANAAALIQALAAAFPAKSGSFLLGLLARITWFTPTLITLDLGLVLEVGARTRLLVLGRVSALLPSADNDLVRLVLDTVGELDFDAGTLAVDAMLVDSRLVHRFPITGSAAVRARWGHQTGATGPSFVLAVGGFNPRFAPPAGFPALERLSIALSKGKNPRLVCESYFAITSNTLQFGARASLYAEAIGFSLTGEIGYDVLVSWAPLHFVADFQGMVQLKRGSHSLFKLELKGTLEGPQPLRLSGKLTFEIFWVSFTVRVDATLADGPAAAGLAAVNVADLLAAAVGATASWRTQQTPGVAHGVALRSVTPDTGPILDPLGQMVLEQQVVPLNLTRDVDTYGGAPVAGPRRFALAGTLNDASGTAVQGAFAPARYFALSDDEKLAAPSFEAMDAGLVLGDATVRYAADAIEAASLAYEPITLNPVGEASAPAADTPDPLPAASLTAHVATGAAARAPVRQVGRARFRNSAVRPAATVRAPEWTIVRTSDGTAAAVDPSIRTWSEQRAALDRLNRGGTAWTMVPAHELAIA